MSTIRHMIPLIGPYPQACKQLGIKDEDEIYSLSAFKTNESECTRYFTKKHINYIDEIDPEAVLDLSKETSMEHIKKFVKDNHIQPTDILTAVPPCAGLSLMNNSRKEGKGWGADAVQNYFMFFVVKFFLATDTKVLVFENAPALSQVPGVPVLQHIQQIIKDNGYDRNITVTAVSTSYHGIPQNRKRTFCYIYKGDSQILDDVRRETPNLTEYLKQYAAANPRMPNDPMDAVPCYSKAFDDMYKACVKNGIKFSREHANTYFKFLMQNKIDPDTLEKYGCDMSDKGVGYYKVLWQKMLNNHAGWDSSPALLDGYINAITSKAGYQYRNLETGKLLTTREMLDLMAYPSDFTIEDCQQHKYVNLICQNIPVNTAADSIKWALQLLEGKHLNPVNNGKITKQNQHDNFSKVEIVGEEKEKPQKVPSTSFTLSK
jgi:site-specific DNA-cytosine methylase